MVVGQLVGRLGPQHLLALARRTAGGSEFLVTPEERLTRRQLFARTEALAAGLQMLGVHSGDRIAALLPACAEAVYALFLPWELGTVEVLLDPAMGEADLRHALAQSECKFVLTTRNWRGSDPAATVAGLRGKLPNLRFVLAQGAGRQENAAYSIEGLITSGTSLWRARVTPKEEGRIAYVACPGAMPRGIAHTRGAYWRLAQLEARTHLDPAALRCLLLPFPPHTYGGWLGIMAALLAGGKAVLTDGFEPQRALETIARERVTTMVGTPAMYRALLEAPGQARADLSSLRRAVLAGPCPPDLARAVRERLRCPLDVLYARPEAGLIAWTAPGERWERVAQTVGRPAPGVQVRIVDGERRPLPVGMQGRVAVRSPQMMAGYHADVEGTAKVLDREGWLYTPDVGWLDDCGYLHLLESPGGSQAPAAAGGEPARPGPSQGRVGAKR